MRVLIVGCGYAGLPLAKRFVEAGDTVCAMRRNGAKELDAAGILPWIGDVADPNTYAGRTPGFDQVYFMASSSRGGIDAYRHVFVDGMKALLAWLQAAPPRQVVFTSSTSVYPQARGETVDENSSTESAPEAARLLIQSEQGLLQSPGNFRKVVLRVAGIYGPGRGHLFAQFVRGEARVLGTGERFLNMIHLLDLVEILFRMSRKELASGIYNAADDEPVTERQFFEWLSKRLNRPFPPPIAPDEVERKRGLSSKRVANQKLRDALEYQFQFPNFRHGYEDRVREVLGQ